MTTRIPENFSAWFVGWNLVTATGDTMPPRDPDDDDDDEDDDERKKRAGGYQRTRRRRIAPSGNVPPLSLSPRSVSCRFCCKSRCCKQLAQPPRTPSFLPAVDWERPAWITGALRQRYLTLTLHSAICGGGPATRLASRRRFWAIAASVNSSCAPRGPRRRRRPSLRMRSTDQLG
jgi:hypothetical protein